MAKIGLGLITCNRPEFCKKCYESIPLDKINEFVVVNDGDELPFSVKNGEYIKNDKNSGVGISKNKAFKYLLDKNCDYIFLIEDDIYITNSNVFDEYIKYIEKTGIQHLMFGYHGPANKINGKPTPRIIIDYGDNVNLALNFHCVGAFCVYSSQLLKTIGLFDEKFLNAWEHIDHSYEAVKKDYLPGYWWWPDISDSYNYLNEQACSEVSSAIRPRNDWKQNIKDGGEHFLRKHNYLPWSVVDTPQAKIIENLRKIKSNLKK